jgi:translation initiation factor 2D
MSNRALIYLVDGVPLFFDPSGGRYEMFPTVYALWALGDALALARVETHSEVSPKVLGGADLMLPGVTSDVSTWTENELAAIYVTGNDIPFAVGVIGCDGASAVASGMKGVGVRLAHAYGDAVWALGDKSAPCAAFSRGRIYKTGEMAPETPALVSETKTPEKATETMAAAMGAMALDQAAPNAVEEESYDVSTPEKMDAMLERCFAIGANKVKDAELPIRCEAFYANFVLPARPEGVQLDLKHSTFKKQAKLFNVMEKKHKLIKTKLVHKIENIIAIERDHALLAKYAAASTTEEVSIESDVIAPPIGSATIEVQKRYRASTMYRPIFGQWAIENKERLYTKAEVQAALSKYVVANSLGDGKPGGEVQLDTLLGKELFNKKEVEYGTDALHPLDDLFERLIGKLQPHVVVQSTRNGETTEFVKKGSLKPIVIKAEDRGRRKYITRISGIETFCISPEELAAISKKEFSASVSIDDMPGKHDHGKELSIQGHVVIQLADLLRKNMGVPAKFIDAQN